MNMREIKEISEIISKIKDSSDIYNFLLEILTESEVITISKRWRILTMLNEGKTQREIAKDMKVSLCNITRGAKIIKNKHSIVTKYLKKEIINDNEYK